MVMIPVFCWTLLIVSRTSCLVAGQVMVAGSSSSSNLGLAAIWRAINNLCFSPPLRTGV